MTESTERRQHPRYEIAAQIRVKRGRLNHIMDVTNISLSGIFVSTESLDRTGAFRVGQEVELDLFTYEELENIRIIGTIARIVASGDPAESGIGVSFTQMTEAARAKLAVMVHAAVERSIHPPPLPGQSGGEE